MPELLHNGFGVNYFVVSIEAISLAQSWKSTRKLYENLQVPKVCNAYNALKRTAKTSRASD